MNNLLKTDSTRTESHYANETKRMQQTFNVYLEVTERDNNVEIKWSILDRTPAFKNCSKRCTEKYNSMKNTTLYFRNFFTKEINSYQVAAI